MDHDADKSKLLLLCAAMKAGPFSTHPRDEATYTCLRPNNLRGFREV
jgi:hypothetical protein